ncbi:MAG: ABC transporter ATP-binding protein [Thermogutta sp.]|nr:ABC transporter ATP-binding protein [Thermogutta sp.]
MSHFAVPRPTSQDRGRAAPEPAQAAAPVIRLRDVVFGYSPDRDVLRGVSLEIQAGEAVGLVGANGSGKTTLLHLLSGLLAPRSGSVEVLGKARRPKDFDEILGRVGLLFQDSDDQLFCPTVAEDVAFGPLNQGRSRREVAELVTRTLEELGLRGYENRVTYRLSGGEKRLVALATVLAMEPAALLLDEPTSGLDEAAAERVVSVLTRLPQAKLIVSHDRPLLRRICRRLVALEDGRLREVREF